MKKRMLCFFMVLALLFTSTYAAGFGAFDQTGHYVFINESYLVEYENIYATGADAEEPTLFNDGLAPVCINSLWGYISRDGIIAIDFTYKYAGAFSQGYAFVETNEGFFCIDAQGNVLFSVDCDMAFPYKDGLAKISKDGLYGFIDTAGTVIAEPIWLDAGYASGGFISVSNESGYGYIDYKGNVFITPEYEVASEFKHGAAYVQKDQMGMLINMEGDVICENVYSGLIDGLAITYRDGGWGFVNPLGEISIPCTWEDVDVPSEGFIGVRKDGKWGFIDYSGAVAIPCGWDYVWPFSDGMAMVATSKDGYTIDKYGFINSEGEQVIPCTYELAKPFASGRAAVSVNGAWGYLDALGTEIIPCTYAFAANFTGDFAVTGNNGVFSVIGNMGDVLTFYREDELPTPLPQEADDTELEAPTIPEEEVPEKEKVPAATIIGTIVACLFLGFLATVIILRELNLRKHRSRRLISRGRGKHSK